jgi:hypothetical protein
MGIVPTEADISKLLQPLDARKILFLLCRMNMHFRLASSSEDTTFARAVGKAQEFLFTNFFDEELFEQIKTALGHTKTHERALFHPLQLLNMMRCAVNYCQTDDDSENVTDEQRYTVARCCLMMNDLLASEEDNQKLLRGSENIRKAELMTQLLPGWEVQNPGNLTHLLHRSLVTFNMMSSDPGTKAEILVRTGGYDFEQRFADLTGLALKSWIAMIFSCLAFYSQYGGTDGSGQNYQYLWIDPRVFIGESKISQADLDTTLSLIAKRYEELGPIFAQPSVMKTSMNITPFKFHPLIKVGYLYLCSDFGFLTEKIFAGAYWTLHDREGHKGRQLLATAWGILFERYVNRWANERTFQKAMMFYPFPVWESTSSPGRKKRRRLNNEESFDGAILQDGRFVALEYKGGFLTLEAKYSLSVRALLRDLNKKIAVACRQLARKIGELFGMLPGRRLKDIPTAHVTRVIPVIVVQDQALRALGVNWWINRQFQREMRKLTLRLDITVEPVTLIHISEFETMIDSAEGPDFDLVGTLQIRNLRDPDAMSDLADVLLDSPGYGEHTSSRRKELDEEFERSILKYAFDIEDKTVNR